MDCREHFRENHLDHLAHRLYHHECDLHLFVLADTVEVAHNHTAVVAVQTGEEDQEVVEEVHNCIVALPLRRGCPEVFDHGERLAAIVVRCGLRTQRTRSTAGRVEDRSLMMSKEC